MCGTYILGGDLARGLPCGGGLRRWRVGGESMSLIHRRTVVGWRAWRLRGDVWIFDRHPGKGGSASRAESLTSSPPVYMAVTTSDRIEATIHSFIILTTSFSQWVSMTYALS